ncbi:hypothetical protein PPYR_03153 [Photinus pyralis]|uniref:Uncharacterized protein n=1 Tax=Photinus pyralis TaxID=7054 RepID=A0A5N4A1Z4_PHOPY|nr:hypothetical protein PPYR_03153 [Photinus pyralis]
MYFRTSGSQTFFGALALRPNWSLGAYVTQNSISRNRVALTLAFSPLVFALATCTTRKNATGDKQLSVLSFDSARGSDIEVAIKKKNYGRKLSKKNVTNRIVRSLHHPPFGRPTFTHFTKSFPQLKVHFSLAHALKQRT